MSIFSIERFDTPPRPFAPKKVDPIPQSLFFSATSLVLLLLLMGLFLPLPSWGQDSPPPEFSRGDPDKYKSAEECGECHELEFEVWKKTRHAIGFKEMHKEDSARKIAKKLGFRLIKRNSLCIACHYTPAIKNGQLRTLSGVSCEACHGPGKDWINIHNDYGGKEFDYKTESPAHRTRRIEESRQAGMMRPSDLYPVVENCFQCHLVPNEELVNVGGHGTGTGDFEFVKMANEIRHNFLLSVREGSKENTVRSLERLRLMYVVGQTVQLEYVLRSLAIATQKGTYATSMIDRVMDAMADMIDLSDLIQVSELNNLGEIVEEEALKPNNKSLLLQAANAVSVATKLFLKNHDGSKLDVLDAEIFNTEEEPEEIEEVIETEEAIEEQAGNKKVEAETQPQLSQSSAPVKPSPPIQSERPKNNQLATVLPKSKRIEPPIQTEVPVTSVVNPPAPVAPATNRALQETPEKIREASPPSLSPRRVLRPKVVGQLKKTIRPGSKHRTLGPRSCGKCHSEQTEWWLDDTHKNTHKPFTAKKGKDHEKAVKIAKLYGVKPSEMAKGTQVCMNCHGTVITKKKKKKVRSGVSCESCHGPAKAYLKPHEDGEKDLGDKRPGYIKGLKLGLVKLKDEAVRAKTCASCHYITDKRLISSGHSSGEKFKYAERVKEIKHWEGKLTSPAIMTKAYNQVITARGPVPKFARVSVAEPKNQHAQKAQALTRKKESSLLPRLTAPPIVPRPEQKASETATQIPAERITAPRISHQEQRAKETLPPPASDKLETAEAEEVEETAEKETLDPEQEQAIQEMIIRDALIDINETIRNLDFGELTFDAPLSIPVNETRPISLILHLDKTIKALNQILKKDADRIGIKIKVLGSLEARLSGRNFAISTISPEIQTIREKEVTEWKWEVTPTKEGSQKLHLSLSALVRVGGKSTLKKMRTFDQKIEVSAGFAGKVLDYFSNNWQWLWAIAFFSGLAWWRGKKST